MKIAKFAGSILASSAIVRIWSSVCLWAFCFSAGVIIATAFFNWASSFGVGAASIANSAAPLMSWNWLRTILPYSLSENWATLARYWSIEMALCCSILVHHGIHSRIMGVYRSFLQRYISLFGQGGKRFQGLGGSVFSPCVNGVLFFLFS